MLSVLGVDVDSALLERWRGWIAPDRQPFVVEAGSASTAGAPRPHPELRDTYRLWKISGPFDLAWLDEDEFMSLPRAERAALVRSQVWRGRGAVPTVRRWGDLLDPVALRSQADGHRFVWWPSLVPVDDHAVVTRVVETGEHASRHREVGVGTWRRCGIVLPGAEGLAGTFAESSGPNCFGTVMAAAGVGAAAEDWVREEAFLAWLAARCRPGGSDEIAGTVLVWSDHEGRPVHAAVTLGDGWGLEKPSQCWWTPRTVLPVGEIRRLNCSPGQRLRRYRIEQDTDASFSDNGVAMGTYVRYRAQ